MVARKKKPVLAILIESIDCYKDLFEGYQKICQLDLGSNGRIH